MSQYIKSISTNEIIEIDQKIVDKVASDWVNISAKVKSHDNVMILYDVGGRQLANAVAKLCATKGCRVWYRVRDLDLDSTLINELEDKEVERYCNFLNSEIMNADAIFMIRAARRNDIMKDVKSSNMALYNNAIKPVYIDWRVKHTNWQLIYWPTEAEAKEEALNLEEYCKLYFNACNQDWGAIEKSQAILVKMLDQADDIEFRANTNSEDPDKRTHVQMSIRGMEFINSTIDRNYPGSEVFSAPVKNSVNGQIYKQGKFNLGHEQKMVEDVYLRFENGKIVEMRSKVNQKSLEEFLTRDEGASYIGEIAIGTNPGLRQNVFNPLLNEKVGGSFHITPGKAYENIYDEKEKKRKKTFNGNFSNIHWDITIMMLPNYGGGEIILDGQTIQKNGKFILKGLEPLNKGL